MEGHIVGVLKLNIHYSDNGILSVTILCPTWFNTHLNDES